MPTPKLIPFLVAMLLLSACGPTSPKQTRAEITGTQTERITRATAILAKYGKLPGPLLEFFDLLTVNASRSGKVLPSFSSFREFRTFQSELKLGSTLLRAEARSFPKTSTADGIVVI